MLKQNDTNKLKVKQWKMIYYEKTKHIKAGCGYINII